MKYLKTYEQAQTTPKNYGILPKEIKEELHDICLELEDIGYEIIFKDSPILGTSIVMSRSAAKPEIEIDEVIERIKDYMSRVGYLVIKTPPTISSQNAVWGDNDWIDHETSETLINRCVLFFRKSKKINESISKDQSFINDFNDICLELRDDRFEICIKDKNDFTSEFDKIDDVVIYIYKDRKNFKFSEISEVIERIIEYSKSYRYDVNINFISRLNNWKPITLEDLYKLDTQTSVDYIKSISLEIIK